MRSEISNLPQIIRHVWIALSRGFLYFYIKLILVGMNLITTLYCILDSIGHFSLLYFYTI